MSESKDLSMTAILRERLFRPNEGTTAPKNDADRVVGSLILMSQSFASKPFEALAAIKEIFDRIDGPSGIAQAVIGATACHAQGKPPESTVTFPLYLGGASFPVGFGREGL